MSQPNLFHVHMTLFISISNFIQLSNVQILFADHYFIVAQNKTAHFPFQIHASGHLYSYLHVFLLISKI